MGLPQSMQTSMFNGHIDACHLGKCPPQLDGFPINLIFLSLII